MEGRAGEAGKEGVMSSLIRKLLRPVWRAPDFIIGHPMDPYLLRWWVIPRNRWFNIYLHKFLRSDDDRALHDHPWASCSIILAGGYLEHLPDGVVKHRRPGRITFRIATQAHRVELLCAARGGIYGSPPYTRSLPAWTVFITGPKRREWGFHCPQGWRHWRDFCGVPVGEARGNEVGRGCE